MAVSTEIGSGSLAGGSRLLSDADQAAADNWAQYTRLRDSGHLDYVTRANECDNYYQGEQWDEADKAKLDAEGRPSLTINEILPTVNTVLGEQVAKRASIRYQPRKNGSGAVATVMTKVAMQVLQNNEFEYKESEVFADGLVAERGYYDIRMGYEDHVLGDIVIRSLNPREVLIDADAESYDPKEWRQVITTRWMSLDDVQAYYGKDKAEKLRGIAGSGATVDHDSIRFRRETTFGDTDDWLDRFGSSDPEARAIRNVRVIERQHCRLTHAWHFVTTAGDLRVVPQTWDEERAAAFAQEYGLELVRKLIKKVRWTVSADRILLHDEWSPYRTFTIVPYFPYFRRGRPFGLVTNLRSPQEQLNKLSSQELHIVNTTANSGWVVEHGSLVGMTEDELVAKGAETGLVLSVAPGKPFPVKIQPNTIPSGLDRISLKAQNNIRSISGVSEAFMGFDTPEISGVALENKERRGQIQLQKPLDNLARTRRMIGVKILELMQQFYTEERTIQITNEWAPGQPEEEVTLNQRTADGVVNDLTLGEYGLVVQTMPAHATFDDLVFGEAMTLRNTGIQIPDHHIVKYSHLPNREELSVELARMQGFGEPTPEEQEMASIQRELQLRGLYAEVNKLEAEVEELESKVRLNQAKAADLDEQGNLEQARMIKELEEKRADVDLRRRLAELSSQTQLRKQAMASETRLAGDSINRTGQLMAARISAAAKNKQEDEK